MSIKVCFVCMGNICRSPTAQGVFETLVKESQMSSRISIDSAGTHAYHIGEPPDHRAQEAAKRRGIDLSRQRARKIVVEDFEVFDYIVVMDGDNKNALLAFCPEEHLHKITLFMTHSASYEYDYVPDPYYGGISGFEVVLDMVESASVGLLEKIKIERGL